MVGELTALPRPRRWIWALRGRTGKTGKERAREGNVRNGRGKGELTDVREGEERAVVAYIG